jgi:hypothetical protein
MTKIAVGDKFHLRAPMTIAFTEHDSQSLQRGTTVTVTKELLEMSKDRNGVSWLDLVDDPKAQTERYGAVKFARGECPPEINWYDEQVGDGAWNVARELEMERVAAISDPVARADAQKVAFAKFGRKPTSQVIATYGPDQTNVYAPSDARGATR